MQRGNAFWEEGIGMSEFHPNATCRTWKTRQSKQYENNSMITIRMPLKTHSEPCMSPAQNVPEGRTPFLRFFPLGGSTEP
jgi:hypothetical protein